MATAKHAESAIPARPVAHLKPVLLLVHGSWFGAWSWESVQSELAERNWAAESVELPSVADRGAPRLGLHEDAEVVRSRIKAIESPVVVVAHSYGGAVVSQGAAGMSNVQHLIYVCGFQLDVGESVLGTVGGAPEWWDVDGDIVTVRNPRAILLDDVAKDVADRAIDRLKPFSLAATTQTLTAAAWHTVPSTYVMTQKDKAIPRGQDVLAARATNVRHLDSGHVPLLSMPSALTDLLVEAAC